MHELPGYICCLKHTGLTLHRILDGTTVRYVDSMSTQAEKKTKNDIARK